jgi:tRNA threonylcarbamoyladenosine biosynthesis protein TsaE
MLSEPKLPQGPEILCLPQNDRVGPGNKQLLFQIVTHSPEETSTAGRKLAAQLESPCLVLLEGELGSGKTTLVKGIVAGLGAAREEQVTSPSFTLVHEYGGSPRGGKERREAPAGGAPHRPERGRGPKVYHVDLYRVESPRELVSLGLDDLAEDDAVVLVEWGEKLAQHFGIPELTVRMEHLGGDDRRITVERRVE